MPYTDPGSDHMPYDVTTYTMQFGGSLPGSEIWSCGLHFSAVGSEVSQSIMQGIVDAAVTPFTTWWNAAGTAPVKTTGTTLSFINLYLIPAGQTASTLVARATFTALAGSSGQAFPNQCALVVTLRTQDPSRRGRGRIYLPILSGSMTGANLTTASTTALAGTVTTLLNSLNGLSNMGVVLGGTSGSPVTSIAIDNVVDTQRRRRNGVAATVSATGTVVAV